jgi:hypothetical protein
MGVDVVESAGEERRGDSISIPERGVPVAELAAGEKITSPRKFEIGQYPITRRREFKSEVVVNFQPPAGPR